MGGITGRGIDVRRRLGSGINNISDEIRDLQTTRAGPIFYRAIVTEVFFDPINLTQADLQRLSAVVRNSDLLFNLPRNSLAVRIVSQGADRRSQDWIICYPFFSHLSLPIKPGEYVWIVFESFEEQVMAYWLSRITEPDHVDDINYTHGDRKFDLTGIKSTSQRSQSTAQYVPPFNNGGSTPDTQTLSGVPNEFDKIFKAARASSYITCESTPRFTKRPGDHVLVGSNNTLIVLGQDRDAAASASPAADSGMIDIVAGRGRQNSPAAPQTINNARGQLETDKNPGASNKPNNASEGDLDFTNDAARFTLFVNAQFDKKISISASYPKSFGTADFKDQTGSACLNKSDHGRMIVRKSGTVRIVKEGDPGQDLSGIFIESNGDMQLDGSRIFIGRTGGSGPGPQGSEPYVKYSELNNLIQGILDDLNSFTQAMAVQFAANTTPGFGAPCPQLVTFGSNDCTKLIQKIAQRKSQIQKIQSNRIFGE